MRVFLSTTLLSLWLTSSALAASYIYYGTTYANGDHGQGSIFKAENGQITTLYSFCPRGGGCNDGANPVGNIVKLPDGAFIGTTTAGGEYGSGVIYRLVLEDGWTEQVLFNLCFAWIDQCYKWGTTRGTLAIVGTDRDGDPILEATSEDNRGRGVLYIFDPNERWLKPLKYWK